MSLNQIPLGEICTFVGGGTPKKSKPEYWTPEVPWASVKDFKSTSLDETQDRISWAGLKNSASNLIKAGTVIIPTRMALGKAAINTIDVAINQDLRALNLADKVDPRYMLHAYIYLGREIEKHGSGATVKGITQDKLREIKIPLPMKNGKPDLDEQRRIASILDQADAIRRKRRQALQLTDAFLRSTFLDLFGDPVTNPKGWDVKLASELFSDKPRIGTTRPAKGQGYIVVRVGELGKTDIEFSKCGRVELSDDEFERFKLIDGDTVIARAIGSKKQLGKASYYTGYSEAVAIDSHVMRLRPDPSICIPIWFYLFITSQGGAQILQRAGGETAVQFNINGKQASSLRIPTPPTAMQKQIEPIWQKHMKTKERQIVAAEQADDLFASLQQRAFKGEL